ncbi:MAG TPA: Tat pathway signal protein, partial [Thermoanaerobaculia bacterium]|nr:Tat pathway signal protein [Thermoanaerobaculia bacterium]
MRKATALVCLLLAACANAPAPRQRAVAPTASDAALLDDVERRSFHFFWDLADPHTQLVPDRWPTPSFSSIAA